MSRPPSDERLPINRLHNRRRLMTRWEYDPERLASSVHLACLDIILKGY